MEGKARWAKIWSVHSVIAQIEVFALIIKRLLHGAEFSDYSGEVLIHYCIRKLRLKNVVVL